MPLELSPSTAGLTEAPWPPVNPAKRGIPVAAKDSFLDICQREKVTFPELMRLNFELDVAAPALKGKWERIVNYYLRKHLKCSKTTAGGNYKFSGGETLYVPAAVPAPVVHALDPITRTGSISAIEKELLKLAGDYEVKLKEKEYGTSIGTFKVKGVLKGKVAHLDGTTEIKAGFSKEEIGAALSHKLSDNISAQIGSKIKFTDLASCDPKKILAVLKEKTEITVKGAWAGGQSPLGKSGVAIEGGIQLSKTPIVVKGAYYWEGKVDIGEKLNGGSFVVAIQVQLQASVAYGLSKELLRRVAPFLEGVAAPAVGTGLFMVSLFALGMYDFGQRRENHERVDLLFAYVFGYESRIFGNVPGWLGVPSQDPRYAEKVKLAESGRRDADADAKFTFQEFVDPPHVSYLKALFMVADARAGTRANEEQARNVLRLMLWRRLEQRYPGLKAPTASL